VRSCPVFLSFVRSSHFQHMIRIRQCRNSAVAQHLARVLHSMFHHTLLRITTTGVQSTLDHHITKAPCNRAPAMNHSGDCEDKNRDATHSQLVFDGPSDERRHGRVPEGRREIGCQVCGLGVAGQEGEVERD
jgi:hypothetical protein